MVALQELQKMVFAEDQVLGEDSGVGSGDHRVLVGFVMGDLDSR
jgi:hypothetical protein